MVDADIAEKKLWWKSKALWFNAIVSGLAALEAGVSMLQPYVPGNVYAWFVVLLTVGNTVLRVITTQGLVTK